MEKMHIITKERDHPKMTDPSSIATKGADLATMTTKTLITK
jgi:hypothetical protein